MLEETLSLCSVSLPSNKSTPNTCSSHRSCCRSRPTTPKSADPPSHSCKEFCTSQTCQKSKNCKESASPYCSYGLKDKNNDHSYQTLSLDNSPDHKISKKRLSKTEDNSRLQAKGTQLSSLNSIKGCCNQRALLTPCMPADYKLNESSTSSRVASNTSSQFPCRKLSTNKPSVDLIAKTARRSSVLKTEDSNLAMRSCKCCNGLNEQNANSVERLPSKHDIGVQTSMMPALPNPSPTCCKDKEEVPPKASLSTSFKGKQQVQCECPNPPKAKQSTCTEKMTGNCECCCKK